MYSCISPPLTSSRLSLQVKVKASCVVQSSKLTISVQPPLAVSQDQFVLEPIGQSINVFHLCPCVSLLVAVPLIAVLEIMIVIVL